MNRSSIDFTAGGIRSERSQGKWLRRLQKLSDCCCGTILVRHSSGKERLASKTQNANGHYVGDRPDCVGRWNLDGGEYGGGIAHGNHAHH